VQTTLLGLAIAVILALVAALVAPLVVDWTHYRAAFESEASRLTGLDVRVNGSIDARILPSPLITLRNVEIGAAGGQPQFRAASLELEVSLGPLLRGEVRANEMHLLAPQISLGLDRSGAVGWPGLSPSFRPEAISISRLNIADGRVTLSDAASGSQLVLQQVSFSGDVGSFIGPFRGEGTFTLGAERYGYRISGGRFEQDSGVKLRLGLDPADYPLTADIDGTLTVDHGVPQFQGKIGLARLAAAALASGQRLMSEPWHAGGAIQATPASASLQDVAFQYGPDERAVILNGSAALTFGEHPHFESQVSALQVDLDRALADPDVTSQPPLVIMKSFFETFATAVKPPIPGAIGIGVEAVTIGGTTLQSLHGDVHFDDKGWSINNFECRAPGLTQISLSGRFDDTAQGLAFSGPVTLASADVDTLLAWLKGRRDLPSGRTRALTARGDVALNGDRIAVEGLTATLDQNNVEGRVAYAWPADNRSASLDADLRAAELDVDAATAFAKSALADNGFELPHQASLALDVGKAKLLGADFRTVKAQIKYDSGNVEIDRLTVGDLGGAAFAINGRIDALSSRPHGQVLLDLDAQALLGLTDFLRRLAPAEADALRLFAARLVPAKIHGVLDVEPAASNAAADGAGAAGGTAKLGLTGQAGTMRVALDGDATGDASHLGNAVVHIDSRLEADDSAALAALLGLDNVLPADHRAGRITISAEGPLNGDLHVGGELSGASFDAAIRGTLRWHGDQPPAGAFQVLASSTDLRSLRHAMTGQSGDAVPISARAALALSGNDLSFTDIAAAIGKSAMHGRLAVKLADPIEIDGDLAADNVDAASFAAMLLGLPSHTPSDSGPWSNLPIGPGAFAAMTGAVKFELDHAAFTPSWIVNNLKGEMALGPSDIAFSDIQGELAGGHVTGELAFHRNNDGLAGHAHLALADADAARLVASANNAVAGRLTIGLQCDGVGRNASGLVGALRGSGTATLADGVFGGIDVAAFDAAIRAADRNGALAPADIEAAVNAAMAHGRFAVTHADAIVSVSGGQLSVSNVTLPAKDGSALSLNGVLDLNALTIDARMTLSEPPPPNALIDSRPALAVNFKGPLDSPERKLDVSALTGWLTLHAAELQTRRIEMIEANRRNDAVGPVSRPEPPSLRVVPPGIVVESTLPADPAAAPEPRPRGLELLRPVLPSVAPAASSPPATDFKPLPPPPPPRAAPHADNGNANAVNAGDSQRRAAPQP
jgi:uncharacterized protein involved in outer membrane biogenesis